VFTEIAFETNKMTNKEYERETIVHDFSDVSTRQYRNVPSEISSDSSRILNVTDLLMPQSQATAVIGPLTSTARK
jgi:hypothetical protein